MAPLQLLAVDLGFVALAGHVVAVVVVVLGSFAFLVVLCVVVLMMKVLMSVAALLLQVASVVVLPPLVLVLPYFCCQLGKNKLPRVVCLVAQVYWQHLLSLPGHQGLLQWPVALVAVALGTGQC